MKLKLLILSVSVIALSSCSSLLRMSADGQRYSDGIYFNGRTAPAEPGDYIPTYKANVNRKLDSSSYLYGTTNILIIADGFRFNRWYWDPWCYDPWYWNSWYGPGWYNPWYWDPWYGPGWYGPGWRPYYPYDPWYRPGWYPGWYGRIWAYPVRSGHSPVSGYRGVNPTHSGGMGSYSNGARYGGSSRYVPQGTSPSSVNRGGGRMGGTPTGGSQPYNPGGGMNRGGGSFGGGASGGMGGGSYGGGARGGMGGGRR